MKKKERVRKEVEEEEKRVKKRRDQKKGMDPVCMCVCGVDATLRMEVSVGVRIFRVGVLRKG